MQTRRDQLQAYRYQVRRVLTALLGSDPESPEQPMRRVATATLSGVMVAVLALVGAGFYGKIHGGSTSKWQQAGALIVERDTGTRYIWADDQLHPVLNYTSARLLLNTPTVPVVGVSQRSLDGAPRGRTVGIVGAPDSLPDASHLVVGPWSVCTQTGSSSGTADSGSSISALTIGARDPGEELADRGLIVRHGSQLFLVWHGRRLATDPAALRSLGLDSQQALDVPAGWLNSIPAGAPLQPPTVDNLGKPGPTVGGVPTTVGDILQVTGAGAASSSFYIALRDGVAPISTVTAALLSGTPGRTQTAAQRVSIADVNAAPQSRTRLGSGELPSQAPELAEVPTGQPVCAQTVDASGAAGALPVLTIGGTALPEPTVSASTRGGSSGTSTGNPTVNPSGNSSGSSSSVPQASVDDVIVAPGTAAVVHRLAADGTPTAGEFLVTDDGHRYALADASVASALGLADAQVVGLPSAVLDLIPAGPTLDPADAREFTGP